MKNLLIGLLVFFSLTASAYTYKYICLGDNSKTYYLEFNLIKNIGQIYETYSWNAVHGPGAVASKGLSIEELGNNGDLIVEALIAGTDNANLLFSVLFNECIQTDMQGFYFDPNNGNQRVGLSCNLKN